MCGCGWKSGPFGATMAAMKIVVAGASGMLGGALTVALRDSGHEVVGLGRRADDGLHGWDPARGALDPALLDGAGAVVNLAGAGVADGRWTAARQAEILESRVGSTRLLVETMAGLPVRPAVFVCASASGFFGDTGEVAMSEEGAAGAGFLAGVCQRWEAEAEAATRLGVRVAMMRLGVVLSPRGGALGKMLPVFRAGLGGPAGNGRQWVSWIAIDDAVAAFVHAIQTESLEGPVNTAAPEPVRNSDLARVLARVLGRPALVPAPAAALRVMFGRMADETVLQSARLIPAKLRRSGFVFRFEHLEPALRHVLGK